MKLIELLEKKTTHLIYARASDTILCAIQKMSENGVGSILVKSDDGQLIGIATERDILRFCAKKQGDIETSLLDSVMTTDLLVAPPDYSIDDALSLMTEHRFRHLPVMQNGQTIGLLSIGDLVKSKLKDVSVEVKYLRDYISA